MLVTGADGFIGRNLTMTLRRQPGLALLGYDLENTPEELDAALSKADLVYHLAGVNRPKNEADFDTGNAGFTATLCDKLKTLGRRPRIVFSSSIQAAFDNPYGRSKRQAEETLAAFAKATGSGVSIYRLQNAFGKWCRPNYNSVVATFCYHLARDLPIQISDPACELDFVYVDDVVHAFAGELDAPASETGAVFRAAPPAHRTSLGRLAELLRAFAESRRTLVLPDLSEPFNRKLYATFLSYLPEDRFAYDLQQRGDPRGVLAEFIKSAGFGQIFVSRTFPGITRGNHYHHSKVEKFLVLEGEALIRFRPIGGGGILEYPVNGRDFKVVDIPPGYTHSIENVGKTEMVVLFWAGQIFDPAASDTYVENVNE